MKVTLKTLYATPERVVPPGRTVDLPKREARALIDGGFAIKAAEDPATRTPPSAAAESEPPTEPEADQQPAGDDEERLRAELTALDRGQLVERAKATGVKANGRSAAIIDRIVDAELSAGDDDWTDEA